MKKEEDKLLNPLNLFQNWIMKKQFLMLLIIFSSLSCDDGELIVTNFNFENEELVLCGSETKVLFKINNTDVNEAIALIFEPENEDIFLENPNEPVEILLNDKNRIVYRTFDAEIDGEYFCNEIPPTTPEVLDEYESTTGGRVVLTPTLSNLDDLDADGVSSEAEGIDAEIDTDADGIPDYTDIDDDGDNVPTVDEIDIESEFFASGFPDTDKDGIPNFLDPDDDNDGTLTIFEDWNEDAKPWNDLNDDGLPYYLDPVSSTAFDFTVEIENKIYEQYQYEVTVFDLTLRKQGGNGEQIRLENYSLGFFDLPVIPVTLTGEEETDEDEDEEETEEETAEN